MTTAAAGEHFGSNFDLARNEILAIGHIDRKLLAAETALYARKWFDYRPLHPVAATYLMVHHYNRAYGDFMGQVMDYGKRFMNGFKGEDFLAAREAKSFWRLRQRIDELGIRYDFFLRAAMTWHIQRGWGREARHPPRPGHLATNDEMIVDVANAWALECRAKIQFASHTRFTVPEWVAAPDQLAYEDWLVTQIKLRPHPKYALHAALYLFDSLRVEAALQHFPAHVVRDACDYCLADISQQ